MWALLRLTLVLLKWDPRNQTHPPIGESSALSAIGLLRPNTLIFTVLHSLGTIALIFVEGGVNEF